jgi:hypothetical protein
MKQIGDANGWRNDCHSFKISSYVFVPTKTKHIDTQTSKHTDIQTYDLFL